MYVGVIAAMSVCTGFVVWVYEIVFLLKRALLRASHEPPGKRVVKSASFGKATGAEISSQFIAHQDESRVVV